LSRYSWTNIFGQRFFGQLFFGQTHRSAPTGGNQFAIKESMNGKPKYNPRIHHRRSIRLKGYDYSQKGLYFITLCVKDRECLFGEIIKGEMMLNDAGAMVEKWFNELENKFPDINCLEHIVMPNHFHCIIENMSTTVGADLRVCPDNEPATENKGDESEKGGHPGPPQRSSQSIVDETTFGEHTGSPLWQVIQWFKTMTTNEYIRNVKANNWPRFNGKLWQRNYWEHIIRNEKSYLTIAAYIINNPKNWDNDSINPKAPIKE
jgi:putative transposase